MRTRRPKGKTALGRVDDSLPPVYTSSSEKVNSSTSQQKQPHEAAFAATVAIHTIAPFSTNLPAPKPYRQHRKQENPRRMQMTLRTDLARPSACPSNFDKQTSFHRTHSKEEMLKSQRSQLAMAMKTKPPPITIPPAEPFVKHTVVDNTTNGISVSVAMASQAEQQHTAQSPTLREARSLKHAKTQLFCSKTVDTNGPGPNLKHSKTQIFHRTPANQSAAETITGYPSYDSQQVVQSRTTDAEPTKPALKRSKTQVFRDALKALKDDEKDVAGDVEVVLWTVKGWVKRFRNNLERKQRKKAEKALTASKNVKPDKSTSIQSTPQQLAPDGGVVFSNSKSIYGTKGKTFEDRVQKMLNIHKEKADNKHDVKVSTKGKASKITISGPSSFVRGVSDLAERLVAEQQTLTSRQNAAMLMMPEEKRMVGMYTNAPTVNTIRDSIGLGIYINENQDNEVVPKWVDLPAAQMREKEKRQIDLKRFLSKQEAVQSDAMSNRKAPRRAIPELKKEITDDDTASNYTRWSDFMTQARPAPAPPVPQMPVFAPKSNFKLPTQASSSAARTTSDKGNERGTIPSSIPSPALPAIQKLLAAPQMPVTKGVAKEAKVFKPKTGKGRPRSKHASTHFHTSPMPKPKNSSLRNRTVVEVPKGAFSKATPTYSYSSKTAPVAEPLLSKARAAPLSSSSKAILTHAFLPNAAPTTTAYSSKTSTAPMPTACIAIPAFRNPFEFEREDDHTLPSGSPTLGHHRESWEDESITRPKSEALASPTTDYHDFLSQIKAESSANPPSPSVYSIRTRATTETDKVRRLSTWDSPDDDQRQYKRILGMDNAPSTTYQLHADAKGKGKARVVAKSSKREKVSVGSYVPARAEWKERQPTMESIVNGLRIDGGDDEDQDVDRNTEYYGFYDDILRTPAMPQRGAWD